MSRVSKTCILKSNVDCCNAIRSVNAQQSIMQGNWEGGPYTDPAKTDPEMGRLWFRRGPLMPILPHTSISMVLVCRVKVFQWPCHGSLDGFLSDQQHYLCHRRCHRQFHRFNPHMPICTFFLSLFYVWYGNRIFLKRRVDASHSDTIQMFIYEANEIM